MMFAVLLVGVIGLVFAIIGYLIGIKKKITLLHDYHYSKVSDADKPAFCNYCGLGVLVIGIGLLLTAVLLALTDSALSFLAFAVGMFAGGALLGYAGRKYNN